MILKKSSQKRIKEKESLFQSPGSFLNLNNKHQKILLCSIRVGGIKVTQGY